MDRASVTLPDVRPLVRHIVERFHPRKVIFFGSYAYGEPHEDSDLDLLVVMPSPPSRLESWKVTAELRGQSPVPLQIVFMSTEEFEETKDVVGGLAYPAHQWGKVLHEEVS